MKSTTTLKTRRFQPAFAIVFILLALLTPPAHAEVPFDPPGTHSTSWLGNTYMDAAGHKVVTEELTDLCVSPNGHVFSSGYAEAWGGGAEYNAADGSFIARYDRFESGFGDPQTIIHYKYGGLDGKSNPIWDSSNATTSVVSEFKPARRLVYDSDADVMYMAGDVKNQNWGSFLRVKKFANWSTGNRTSGYTVDLPYQDTDYAGRSNYGGGQPAAFSVAGDYIFVLYGVGHLRILNKTDGSLVGTLRQNVNGWKGSDGQVDAAYGMTVTQRKNGEYIILFENAAWANIMMTRWCPSGTCASAPTGPASPTGRTATHGGTVSSQGFVPLFSDDTLKQWRQCGPGRFIVTNGVATGEGGMGLWWYAGRQFTNFVLRGEFVQEQAIADSGVFLRFPDPGQDPWVAVKKGHEMEIGDPNPTDPTWRTGSIYPFAASVKANTKPVGQWNTFEITCNGQEYTVRINGEVVTRWTDSKARTSHGFIGLQNYNDKKTVRYRNLRIQELP
jgi:hypothetical protein